MTIGGSIFLIAIGAILNWAVTTTQVAGVQLQTVGVILMVCGLLGLIIGLYMISAWNPRRAVVARDARYVEREPPL